MLLNPLIPPDSENRWTAFLNGESDGTDVSNTEALENADFTAAWEAAGNHFSYSSANPDQAWLNLQKALPQQDKKGIVRVLIPRILKYAAMIIMVSGIGLATYKFVHVPDKQVSIATEMVVATTEAHPLSFTSVTFPDGSIAKINANSNIEYPVTFDPKVRRIKLSGEAFFEVTRDTARPFIIETPNASVEVLGTSFNVSAYPKAGLVEVNVKTGKVKLIQNAEGAGVNLSILLPAGERGWLNVAEKVMGQSLVNPNYSSWITKQMIFQRTPLAEAFSVIENTYHIKISFENPEIGRIPYTANFSDLKLDDIVEVIARTHKLKYKRNGSEIIFANKVNSL